MTRPRLTVDVLCRIRTAITLASVRLTEDADAGLAAAVWGDAAAWVDAELDRREIRSLARKTRSRLRRRVRRLTTTKGTTA